MKNLVLLLTLCLTAFPAFAEDKKESAYERVMRTGTIKCGYGVGAPLVGKDPLTGEVSGIMPDIMKEMAKALSLNIEWESELDWGDLAVALKSGKADAICSTMWASGGRGRQIAYTRPLFFSHISIYAKERDTRFDNNMERINSADIRILTNDHDVSEEIANADFPKAQKIPQGALSGEEIMFLDLVMDKADIVFAHDSYAKRFMDKNPEKIRLVPMELPIRTYDNVLGVDIYEQELRDVLNAGIGELLNSGAINRILDRYEGEYPNMLLRVAKPYELP